MKQKLLSWGDDFYIKDEEGRDVYFVDGKASAVVVDQGCHPDDGKRH